MKRLSQCLQDGGFVVTVELNPPKGTDLTELMEKAELLRDRVHGFNITESSAARMACDPLAVAHCLAAKGMEPIVQMTSRDKNRIALQSKMLGASVLGIHNLVFMGGDPPSIGDHPEAKPVFDLFASQLVEAATSLKNGTDLMGNPLRGVPDFFIGSVFNPGAADMERELENTRSKLDAGAEFFQTQAIYDPTILERFLDSMKGIGKPILGGVIPVKSEKMARHMNERVPGIVIPEELIGRIAKAEKTGDVIDVSLDIAADSIRRLRLLCRGIHIMAIGWERHIPDLLARV